MAFTKFIRQATDSAQKLQAVAKDFVDKPETRDALDSFVKKTQSATRSVREYYDDHRKVPTTLQQADAIEAQINLENAQYVRALEAHEIEKKQLAARRLAGDDENIAIYDVRISPTETIRGRAASIERRRIELKDDRELLDKRMETLEAQVSAIKASETSRRESLAVIESTTKEEAPQSNEIPKPQGNRPPPFVLGEPWKPFLESVYIADTTGEFMRMNHLASPPPGVKLFMSFQDLYKSVMITGSVGSGKTTAAYYPLIYQLAACHAGGLVFAQKEAAVAELKWLFERLGRKTRVVGVNGDLGLNILKGWDPVKAAEAIGDFLDREAGESSLWLGLAKTRIQNCLFILRLLPSEYTFTGVAKYLADEDYRDKIEGLANQAAAKCVEEAKIARESGNVDKARDLEDQAQDFLVSLNWEQVDWAALDPRMQSDTQSHLLKFLPMFKRSAMARAWCGADASLEEVDLTQCLDGEIFIVSSGMERWGEIANFALALVKRRWFDLVISRSSMKDRDQSRPLFIALDEYQDFADTHDGDMLGLLRQYKHITIAATQGYTSIYEAIRKDESARKIILNFVTQIALSSTDTKGTIAHFGDLFGETEQYRVSHSSQRGGGSGYNTGSSDGGQSGSTSRGKSENKSFSKSSSAQLTKIAVVSPQTFHGLTKAAKDRNTGEVSYPTAIATVAIGKHQLSDIVVLKKPMFPENG